MDLPQSVTQRIWVMKVERRRRRGSIFERKKIEGIE